MGETVNESRYEKFKSHFHAQKRRGFFFHYCEQLVRSCQNWKIQKCCAAPPSRLAILLFFFMMLLLYWLKSALKPTEYALFGHGPRLDWSARGRADLSDLCNFYRFKIRSVHFELLEFWREKKTKILQIWPSCIPLATQKARVVARLRCYLQFEARKGTCCTMFTDILPCTPDE